MESVLWNIITYFVRNYLYTAVVTKLAMVRNFDTVLTKFNAVGIFWLTLCTLKLQIVALYILLNRVKCLTD